MNSRLPVWLAAASLMALAAGVGGVPTPVDQAAAATPPDLSPAVVSKALHDWRRRLGPGSVPTVARQHAIRASVDGALRGSRATVQRLRFFGGSVNSGALIVLRTDTPPQTLRKLKALVLVSWEKAGVSPAFRLRDSTGGTVWVAGSSGRTGFVWSRRDLDACQPVVHSTPVSTTPPPACPA